jgi:alanine racemase
MSNRREFLASATALSALPWQNAFAIGPAGRQDASYDAVLEVSAAALRANVRALAELAGGRPIVGVVKNNAYGLGLREVGPIIDALPEIAHFAVVKAAEAVELRAAGVRKPILLMGRTDEDEALDLVRHDVRLAPFGDDAPALLARIAARTGAPVPAHLYIDTGMSRLGMPDHRALPWIAELARSDSVRIEGMFTTFTEDEAFDREQLDRFIRLAAEAHDAGIDVGLRHAASTHALFFRDAFLDAVRPGLALYGAYPAGAAAAPRTRLTPAFRLRARVVRLERLRTGDTVSYGRNYVAERPTWIATLPCGHVDGVPRTAVNGGEVLVRDRTYPIIGAVSASHTIIEVGDEPTVQIGDLATLVGPDHPAIHPNTVAERAGVSVYDVLMHLSAKLPVRVV